MHFIVMLQGISIHFATAVSLNFFSLLLASLTLLLWGKVGGMLGRRGRMSCIFSALPEVHSSNWLLFLLANGLDIQLLAFNYYLQRQHYYYYYHNHRIHYYDFHHQNIFIIINTCLSKISPSCETPSKLQQKVNNTDIEQNNVFSYQSQ